MYAPILDTIYGTLLEIESYMIHANEQLMHLQGLGWTLSIVYLNHKPIQLLNY